MVAKNLWPVLIGLSILTACQSIPVVNDEGSVRTNEPKDVEQGSSTQPVTPLSEPKTSSKVNSDGATTSSVSTSQSTAKEVTEPVAPSPSPEQVVTRLQMEALQLQSEGRWSEAELKLERALRIDADKVDLYHQLATVRLGQERFAQAEQIAMKGLTLTDRTPKYKSSLWEVIAQCRSALGDIDGARQARAEMVKWLDVQ